MWPVQSETTDEQTSADISLADLEDAVLVWTDEDGNEHRQPLNEETDTEESNQ